MVCGIGTDIVEVKRMRAATERWGRRFLEKVFSDREIAYSFAKRDPYPHLAARFAAKEAMVKALGCLRESADIPAAHIPILRHFEVVSDSSGRPTLGILVPLLPDGVIAHLSLSHEKEYAVAVVVLERREPEQLLYQA